jgi:hypothetical protein
MTHLPTELIAITSIICNLALLRLCWWLHRKWRRWHRKALSRVGHIWNLQVDADIFRHHLRKANKGCRRLNRLVKRERREKEALVALLEMDGGKVRFNPSPEVGVLVLYPESLEMFETPDVGEEVVV